MIVIVDYGMGNLRSVAKALESLGAEARVSSDPRDVARASKLILPGVGAFGAAMEELQRRRLIDPITDALGRGVPYLGICLGLQLLFDESEEGNARGLGILKGRVRRFPDVASGAGWPVSLKIPHMGWNQISNQQSLPAPRSTGQAGAISNQQTACPVLAGIPEGSYFYFVHSYYAEPVDRSIILLEADYGIRFPAMIWSKHLYATQFHPEKSQALGLRFLENFLRS